MGGYKVLLLSWLSVAFCHCFLSRTHDIVTRKQSAESQPKQPPAPAGGKCFVYTPTQPTPFTLPFTPHHCELWGVSGKRKKREKRKCSSPGLKEAFLAWEWGKRKWRRWWQPASVHGCLFKLAFLGHKDKTHCFLRLELIEPARTRSLQNILYPSTPRSCSPLSALTNHGGGPDWPAPDDGKPISQQRTQALFLEGVIVLD